MTNAATEIPERVGNATLDMASRIGGIAMMMMEVGRRLFALRIDRSELVRSLHRMGVRSVPIVCVTAFFAGATVVITAAPIVVRLSGKGLLGWGATFTVFREMGPLLIALMFNGRVGANNTAELGTMVVTEQVDALRALAIDPISLLVVPRIVAIVTIMASLVVIGDFLAILGAMGVSYALLDIHPLAFYSTALPLIDPWDFYVGIEKAILFGTMIAFSSCYFGLATKNGAEGVGRAVNASVVASAAGVFIVDYLTTFAS